MDSTHQNNLLFHYTTIEAVLGMFNNINAENKQLTFWASHVGFQNDPHEMLYGINLMMEVIPTIEAELNIPTTRRFGDLKENKRKAILLEEYKALKTPNNTYTISFSKNHDDLHMWNMYGKNGAGICLGFNPSELETTQSEYKHFSCEMRYGKPSNNEWINNIKRTYKEKYLSIAELFSDSDKKIADAMYFAMATYAARGIKDPAYQSEKEVRLYYEEPKEIKFRARNGMLIPYIEVKIPISALKIIRLGPTVDSELSRTAIMKFIKFKMKEVFSDIDKHIEFHTSDIPFVN